ncbi:unnamed protein product [Linum trigynum]|uniref:Uncharacterized protein n=1 Tax=Linum trigynum TaxID=586398 RepID=A0AAV2EBQ6_9ROSI
MRGDLSSFFEFWTTALLPLFELGQLAGTAVLSVCSTLLCFTLDNQGIPGFRRARPFTMVMEKDLKSNRVAFHKKRPQVVESSDSHPGTRRCVGVKGSRKRLRDQSNMLIRAENFPNPKRFCLAKRGCGVFACHSRSRWKKRCRR